MYLSSQSYDQGMTLASIVDEFLQAQENFDISAMQVWTNEKLAQGWELKGESVAPSHLMEKAEKYSLGSPPPEVITLTAGVDVQKDRLEIVVLGWGYKEGVGHQMWIVDYHVIYSPPTDPGTWDVLSTYLFKPFGKKLIKAIAVDTGGLWTQDVYGYCRKNYSKYVFGIKGGGKTDAPIVSRPTIQDIDMQGKKIRRGVRLWVLNTHQIKNYIHQTLERSPDKIGAWHFSKELAPAFYDQLTSEQLVKRKRTGELVWELPGRARNEVLDCTVYAIAAGYIIGLDKQDFRLLKKKIDQKRNKVSSEGWEKVTA